MFGPSRLAVDNEYLCIAFVNSVDIGGGFVVWMGQSAGGRQ